MQTACVLQRLRAAITYLAIHEVMQYLLQANARIMDVAAIGVAAYIVSGFFLAVLDRRLSAEHDRASLSANVFELQLRLLRSVNRLSIMMSAQALATWAQPAEFDRDGMLSVEQTLAVVMWVVGMVAVLSLLPGGFVASEQGASFQSVLLYTFTNGIEIQFYKLRLDRFVLACSALALLYYLQQLHARYLAAGARGTFRCMLHEAVCMVLTNVCISSVLEHAESSHAYKNVLSMAQILGGLILVSFLAERMRLADSVQTLVLWRASREISAWAHYFTADPFAILVALFMAYTIAQRVQQHIALTVMLVLSKHIVSMSLAAVKLLPRVPSIVASQLLLVLVDIVAAHLAQDTA